MADEGIWCEVRIEEVVDVLDDYKLWKDGSWYHSIDWRAVCSALVGLVQSKAVDGVVADLRAELAEVAQGLSDLDHQALVSLVNEPITVTQTQLTNGGHRLAAMCLQGVTIVPGLFHRADVGFSVKPEWVYPISFDARYGVRTE